MQLSISKSKLTIIGLIFVLVLMLFIVCAVLFQKTSKDTVAGVNEANSKTGLIVVSSVASFAILVTTVVLVYKLQLKDE